MHSQTLHSQNLYFVNLLSNVSTDFLLLIDLTRIDIPRLVAIGSPFLLLLAMHIDSFIIDAFIPTFD